MGIKVFFGEKIAAQIFNFPDEDLQKIFAFKQHIEMYGFENLIGRNKSSDDVSKNDPFWSVKVARAQEYNLWHYHIGIPNYDTSKGVGNFTSQYVLHYIKGDGFIKIVDFSAHPPFQLPTDEYLK